MKYIRKKISFVRLFMATIMLLIAVPYSSFIKKDLIVFPQPFNVIEPNHKITYL